MHECIEAVQSSQAARGEAHRRHTSRRGHFPLFPWHGEKVAPFFSLSWASEKAIRNLQDAFANTVWVSRKRARRFRLACFPKLEYSVWPYTVQVHRLIKFRPSAPKQGVRGVSGRGRNRSVRTLKRCPGRSTELFERYILVNLTVTRSM